jgi:hypothetical protein
MARIEIHQMGLADWLVASVSVWEGTADVVVIMVVDAVVLEIVMVVVFAEVVVAAVA